MRRLPSIQPRLSSLTGTTGSKFEPPKDDHYNSPEHHAWSKAVIERAGGICQGLNCGRTGIRLYADHIRERADGGADFDLNNGQALCGSCHVRKTIGARRARLD